MLPLAPQLRAQAFWDRNVASTHTTQVLISDYNRNSDPPSFLLIKLTPALPYRPEVDTDLFFASDDHTFDPSLFALMASIVKNLFDRGRLAYHKFLRYNQSRTYNPSFYFGPKAPFFEATAASIFEAFASYGNEGIPDLATVQVMFSRCTGNTQCFSGETLGRGIPT